MEADVMLVIMWRSFSAFTAECDSDCLWKCQNYCTQFLRFLEQYILFIVRPIHLKRKLLYELQIRF